MRLSFFICAGTGVTYPPLPVWTGPKVLDYTQAAEIDAQFFFSGTPWDMVARNYTALTLNIANNSTLTQYDVVGKDPTQTLWMGCFIHCCATNLPFLCFGI